MRYARVTHPTEPDVTIGAGVVRVSQHDWPYHFPDIYNIFSSGWNRVLMADDKNGHEMLFVEVTVDEYNHFVNEEFRHTTQCDDPDCEGCLN